MTAQAEIWRNEREEAVAAGYCRSTAATLSQLRAAGLEEGVDFRTVHSWQGSRGFYNKKSEYLLNDVAAARVEAAAAEKRDAALIRAAGGRLLKNGWKFHKFGGLSTAEAVAAAREQMTRNEVERQKAALDAMGEAAQDIKAWMAAGCPHPLTLNSPVYAAKIASGKNWKQFAGGF